MIDRTTIPNVRDLILVGGGHAHIQVLKSFGMNPESGVRLTLVCPDVRSPYSGMLPGCVAGVYSQQEIHIDLLNLCRFAGARLVQAAANRIDPIKQVIGFADRPDLRFDLASLNCGATPQVAHPLATVVKPIGDFLPKWQSLQRAISDQHGIAIVGAGAGGIELAFAMRQSLPKAKISLIGPKLLNGMGRISRKVGQELQAANIEWLPERVLAEHEKELTLSSGRTLVTDEVVWVTGVKAASWLKQSCLETDDDGFVCVNENLQSVSHTNVFAAGDIADLVGQARQKSGVFAVRQGPYLADNLRRVLTDKPLRGYQAQTKHIALLGLGQGRALAVRGGWAVSGKLWWLLKQRIDQRFVRKFNQLPLMQTAVMRLPGEMQKDLPDTQMRCGGCGAKVAAEPLKRVLARLPKDDNPRVKMGIGDDAAEVVVSSGSQLLTVDGFRAMVDDPYIFGRIAAHHSLNDIFAMGGEPTAALALVTVPLMAQAMMEEDLFQLLSGVMSVLSEHQVSLVGGHSAEGAELSVGLTITGECHGEVRSKGGAQVGQKLILTKPLGTGVVLAGAMQQAINAQDLTEVVQGMDQSNALAARTLTSHGASALTDVTGFGFLGHLGEVLRASKHGVVLNIEKIPFYRGVSLFKSVESSLQQANELNLQDYELRGGLLPADPRVRALMDPQTSGGLLASVPSPQADACVQILKNQGYEASVVGAITTSEWVIEAE